MPRVAYTGHMSVTYPNYTDLATGKALAVRPAATTAVQVLYDIQAVSGPDIPGSDFVLIEPENEEEPVLFTPEVEE